MRHEMKEPNPTHEEFAAFENAKPVKPRAGEHTKGPWFLSGVGTVLAGKSRYIVGDHIELHNARRIVAAVNALEGWPTEALEMAIPGSFFTAISVQTERDALREQLETCKAAHMSNCLDADKLRTRTSELREVLEHVCDTISGPAPALRRAREILAKHGR